MPTVLLVETKRDEWKEMLDINVMGVLNGIAAVLPKMVEQKSGHIISTDSVAGHVVYPGSVVYCGTKFAVRAIMEGLRQEQRKIISNQPLYHQVRFKPNYIKQLVIKKFRLNYMKHKKKWELSN